MQAIGVLKNEAALAYAQLQEALATVTEPLSWAKTPLSEGAYLHTNGTILGMVQHIAVCKFIYGSAAFRSLDVRWRACFDRLEAIGTSWAENLAYLEEAHEYWMNSWSNLRDEELDAEYMRFSGEMWPGWKLIATVTQHDTYHGGQIALLSSILSPADTPPDMDLDGERKYVVDLPTW